jgi:hypothetical protein
MFEVAQAGIAYMFDIVGLHRIMANHMPANVRSEKLLRRLGFEREGVARAYLKINGPWEDHVLNALVNEHHNEEHARLLHDVTMARMQFFKDLSLSAFTAGFVAVLVGFHQFGGHCFPGRAGVPGHAGDDCLVDVGAGYWAWACAPWCPRLWLKKPVMVAWSTPGAAVLASAGAIGRLFHAGGGGRLSWCAQRADHAGGCDWLV